MDEEAVKKEALRVIETTRDFLRSQVKKLPVEFRPLMVEHLQARIPVFQKADVDNLMGVETT